MDRRGGHGQADFGPINCHEKCERVTKKWPVTAPGSQGVFRGRGRGFGFLKNGRQAAIVLSWLLSLSSCRDKCSVSRMLRSQYERT
jgi:hypothetical protein